MPTIAELTAQVEELRAENSYLKRELGLEVDDTVKSKLRTALGIRPYAAKLLTVLYQRADRITTKDALMNALYGDSPDEPEVKILTVWISNIRRKMPEGSIGNDYGEGYTLLPIGKKYLDDILRA